MEYPKNDSIVFVHTANKDGWYKALFYMNGTQPVFTRFGTSISNVTTWRYADAAEKVNTMR